MASGGTVQAQAGWVVWWRGGSTAARHYCGAPWCGAGACGGGLRRAAASGIEERRPWMAGIDHGANLLAEIEARRKKEGERQN